MILKVVKTFHDKNDFGVVYKAGETYTFTEERAKELIAAGVVEVEKKKRKTKE